MVIDIAITITPTLMEVGILKVLRALSNRRA
jgi:hypothetical protein